MKTLLITLQNTTIIVSVDVFKMSILKVLKSVGEDRVQRFCLDDFTHGERICLYPVSGLVTPLTFQYRTIIDLFCSFYPFSKCYFYILQVMEIIECGRLRKTQQQEDVFLQ